jgi:hypothetical protein
MLGSKTLLNINKIISGNISENDCTIMKETLIILIEMYKEKLAYPCLVCDDKVFSPKNMTKKFDNYFHYSLAVLVGWHNNNILCFDKMSFLVETKGHWTAVQLYIFQGKFYFSYSMRHQLLRCIAFLK